MHQVALIFALVLSAPEITVERHPALTLAFWREVHIYGKPLQDKFAGAPPTLVEYIREDNRKSGYPNKPVAVSVDPQFQRDLRLAVAELPTDVQEAVNASLLGVFLVNDLGGSAYTDMVFDEENRPAGAFVVLDRTVLDRNANEWFVWKESSPFKKKRGFRVAGEIEPAATNDRARALQYILLHEFGHVLSVGRDVHPPWHGRSQDPRDFSFSRLSWALPDPKPVSIADESFPERRDVVYYLGAKLPINKFPQVYGRLVASPFVTLYAATSPGDDFADTFAWYVHTQRMGKPWVLRLERDGKTVFTYDAAKHAGRMKEKIRLIEDVLGNAPSGVKK